MPTSDHSTPAHSDPTAQHISELIVRRQYVEHLDTLHGRTRWRDSEHDALVFAIKKLSAMFPSAVAEAYEIAEMRARRRADRDSGKRY